MSERAHPRGDARWRTWSLAFPGEWRSSAPLACCVAFAGTLVVAMLQGEKPFYGDSHEYWFRCEATCCR
jgi:hypothetical protein